MLSRQPTELDYADSTKFRFKINKLPKVEFFTTQCTLPGINLGDVVIPSPFKEIPIQGHTLTYDNLDITFLVDEKLENYIELHQWLVGIGFPKARTQFESFKQNNSDAFPVQGGTKGEATNPGTPSGVQGMYGDATLVITSSKNNPSVEVRFSDLYPVSLGSLNFNQQEGDITYLTATCTFTYLRYEIFSL
tara:strand:+ start:480 stop:1052 length:573 start_codon:yes stop_codon:yes gene_type:complete